jgi:hypothetical protein
MWSPPPDPSRDRLARATRSSISAMVAALFSNFCGAFATQYVFRDPVAGSHDLVRR